MLQAYFDDSSSEHSKRQKRVFVLAGFLSMAERWNAFSDEWDRALDDLPDRKRGGRKRLKMSAAMSARSRGSNSRALWDPLFSKFQSIIERHAMLGFGCVVDLDAFEEHLKSNDDRVLVQRAYQIAFFGVMGATMRYHEEKALTEKVDFVFDDQGAAFDEAQRAFLHFWRSEPYLTNYIAGTPRSGRDEEILPLQAADWLVWQLRFRFASAGAKSDLSIDEDKLFITHKAEDASQARFPVLVNIWDGRIMEVVRDNVLNRRLTELDEMDMPPELREHVRRILTQKR